MGSAWLYLCMLLTEHQQGTAPLMMGVAGITRGSGTLTMWFGSYGRVCVFSSAEGLRCLQRSAGVATLWSVSSQNCIGFISSLTTDLNFHMVSGKT